MGLKGILKTEIKKEGNEEERLGFLLLLLLPKMFNGIVVFRLHGSN